LFGTTHFQSTNSRIFSRSRLSALKRRRLPPLIPAASTTSWCFRSRLTGASLSRSPPQIPRRCCGRRPPTRTRAANPSCAQVPGPALRRPLASPIWAFHVFPLPPAPPPELSCRRRACLRPPSPCAPSACGPCLRALSLAVTVGLDLILAQVPQNKSTGTPSPPPPPPFLFFRGNNQDAG
jgi:hypothetical protein